MNRDEFSDPKYLIPLRAFWRRYVEIGLSSLFINGFALAVPLFSMLIYDKVVGNNITETLWALVIGMLLFSVLDFILRTLRAFYIEQIAVGSDLALDKALVGKLLVDDISKIPPVGSLLSSYRELTGARDFLSAQTITVLGDLPFTLLYLIALTMIGGTAVLPPVLIGCLVVGLQTLFSLPARDYHQISRKEEATKLGLLTELLSGAEAFASTHMGKGLRQRWLRISERQSVANGKGRFWNALIGTVTLSSTSVVYVATMVVGVYLIESQQLTIGGLTACTMLSSRVMANIAQGVTVLSKYRALMDASRGLNALVHLSEKSAQRPPMGRPVEGRIFVRGVTHRFRKEGLASLDNVSLSIEPGERIGIVGRPGSGKTTLVRALAGVIAPSSGDVLIDGVPIHTFLPEERADWMVFKPQEQLLFAGTVEHNIRAGNEIASTDEVMGALVAAGMREAIRIGELSLAHEVAPYGANLSGGQRQAIMLARALLSPGRLVILDEPTSGFDVGTEQAVVQYMAQWCEGKTLILATHSPVLLTTLCTRIIAINGGKVVADGPREQILKVT
ncbi:MAG: hypothetical protein RIR70_769 [Pseudomonadota bacterium]|jgi:ATP-binding cassette subfamily B protein/ATP-binding cassette subfamily C protein LapB